MGWSLLGSPGVEDRRNRQGHGEGVEVGGMEGVSGGEGPGGRERAQVPSSACNHVPFRPPRRGARAEPSGVGGRIEPWTFLTFSPPKFPGRAQCSGGS